MVVNVVISHQHPEYYHTWVGWNHPQMPVVWHGLRTCSERTFWDVQKPGQQSLRNFFITPFGVLDRNPHVETLCWLMIRSGISSMSKKTQCSSQICQPCLIQHRRVTHQSWTNHWDLMCVYIYTIICLCSIYVYTYIHTFILGFPIINKSSSNHQSIINQCICIYNYLYIYIHICTYM